MTSNTFFAIKSKQSKANTHLLSLSLSLSLYTLSKSTKKNTLRWFLLCHSNLQMCHEYGIFQFSIQPPRQRYAHRQARNLTVNELVSSSIEAGWYVHTPMKRHNHQQNLISATLVEWVKWDWISCKIFQMETAKRKIDNHARNRRRRHTWIPFEIHTHHNN